MAEAKTVALPKGVSEEEVMKGLKLLEQQKAQRAKYKERIAEKTPEQKAKEKERYARYSASQRITLIKAAAAGITVTEKEIDEYLAKQAKEAAAKA